MNKRWMVSAIVVWLAATASCFAAGIDDSVRTIDDTKYEGRITAATANEITIERLSATEKIPVNQVASLSYAADPAGLRSARSHVTRGDWDAALKVLATVKPDSVDREEIRQDIEYFQAYCTARQALGGNGDIAAAGKQLLAFVKAYPDTYHYYEASETLGDLLVARRQYAMARQYYEQVNKAPWPDYKARASVAMGRACLADNKPQEALAYFDSVLAIQAEGESIKLQRQAAILGKARCLGETNPDAAIKAVETVIAGTAPEDEALLAAAYNALGYAHRKAGRPQEALFAYLHVDTLYAADAEAHAEALFNLVQLFRETGKQARAKDAQSSLLDQYKDSHWSQQLEQK